MRIIGGEFRGRKIITSKGPGIRPATDRVKGVIFNVLQNRLPLRGALVLDLFAGSGSLGFEALSRGAARGVFVDSSPSSLAAVRENARALECGDRCELIRADGLKFVENCSEQFDLIFADPPYAFLQTAELPLLVFRKELLKSQGFLIIEHSKQTQIANSEKFQLAMQKEFGSTRVSFLNHRIKAK